MMTYWHSMYKPALYRILGCNLNETFGVITLIAGLLLAALVLHLVINSSTHGRGSYRESVWIMGLVILFVPVVLLLVDHYADSMDPVMPERYRRILAFLIPAVLIGGSMICLKFKTTLVTAAAALTPALIVIILFVFLLNMTRDALQSGGKKADTIRSRTTELDRFLGR